MAKLTAWLVTIVGILLVLAQLNILSMADAWVGWVVALAVLIIGIAKLGRNYSKKKRR